MHIQRMELMQAYLRSVGGIIAACIRALARVCVRLARQVVAWQRLQRDIRALQNLTIGCWPIWGCRVMRSNGSPAMAGRFARRHISSPIRGASRAKAWSKNRFAEDTQVCMITCGEAL
jgi:hypothetical protein